MGENFHHSDSIMGVWDNQELSRSHAHIKHHMMNYTAKHSTWVYNKASPTDTAIAIPSQRFRIMRAQKRRTKRGILVAAKEKNEKMVIVSRHVPSIWSSPRDGEDAIHEILTNWKDTNAGQSAMTTIVAGDMNRGLLAENNCRNTITTRGMLANMNVVQGVREPPTRTLWTCGRVRRGAPGGRSHGRLNEYQMQCQLRHQVQGQPTRSRAQLVSDRTGRGKVVETIG